MKKLIALIAIIAVFANLVPVTFAARLNIEEDFEEFVPGKNITVGESGYKIGKEDSNYLIVPITAETSAMPVIKVNYAKDFTFEFDAKSVGQQQTKIEAKFEDGEYYVLYQFLDDGRGPILRLSDESPIFLYKSDDKIPAFTDWHSFKLTFSYETNTIAVQVDGVPIEKYYGRNYVDATPTFSGAKIESIRLTTYTNKTGDACYDNIRVYAGTGEDVEEVFLDDLYKRAYKKIEKLGGVPDLLLDYPMEQNLTRAEFTTLIMQTLGLNVPLKNGNIFEDVSSDSEYSAAVDMAAMSGFVSRGTNFRPNDPIKISEAVTMLCNIIGYDEMATTLGKWPMGHMRMADEYYLLKNITVADYTQYVNVKDVYILAENMLTAPMHVMKMDSINDITIEEKKNMTVLYKYHGLKEIKCTVTNYDEKNKLITFTEEKGATYTAEYGDAGGDIEDSVVYAWVTKDYEKVSYIYPTMDSAVVYGYIEEVNGSDDNKAYSKSEINRVMASTCVTTHLSGNAKIIVDGSELLGTVSPVGKYARIVIARGEIIKLDIYSLQKGGIIELSGSDRIIYTNGIVGYSLLEKITETKTPKVIINNNLSNIKDLKPGMYFEYAWINGGLTVVASANTVKGILNSASAYQISIKTEGENKYFKINSSDFYIAEGEDDYSSDLNPADFMGSEVTVYADSNGYARYMKAAEKNEFYGVVINSDEEPDEYDNPLMTLAKIENGAIVRKTYEVKIKNSTIYYPEVSFFDAAANCKKTNGSGIYKFTVKNNRITKIEAVKWHNDGEVTLAEDFDYRAVRVKFNDKWHGINQNRILLLKNARGEFDVQLVKWSELVSKLASGTKALVESTEPVAKIMILTDYEQSVKVDGQAFGFMEDIDTYYGDDDEIHVNYNLAWRGNVKKIDSYEEDILKFNSNPVKKFDYIEYDTGTLNKFNGGMSLKALISLSEPWSEKKTSSLSFVHLGSYVGITNGYLKTKLAGEYKYLLLDPSGYSVYSANGNHTKFTSASINDIVGKDIWAISIGDIARTIFFEK